MGQRRKRTTATAQQHITPVSEEPANTMPSTGPRRSNRKTGDGIGMRVADVDSKTDAKTGRARRTKSFQGKNLKEEDADDMDIAIEGLREMEDSLRNAVKRQKLAVGQTSFSIPTNALHEEAKARCDKPRTGTSDMLSVDETQPKAIQDDQRQALGWGRTPPREKIDRDPESPNEDDDATPEDESSAVRQAAWRPPPVNSDYLPLPWKGRLGYACLNTYLRLSNPPVFSSRTCRIASIIEHRHPLAHPDQPEHPTKNRPDKEQPADIKRGQKYVENLGLANARDIVKMLRWNDKYGIKFMRLSSEMFPFASHEEYGYKLAPFASEVLAEAGKVAGELGHRLTTHPGQFTQLGSPRTEVVRNAVRDLNYHDELLTLLRLPEQQNKDAVMILHMGGVFGDKAATLDRFRENYAKLTPSVKARLVLENDDVSWTVHDLLPICEELNIPMVLDYHHHNIMFDAEQIREGTRDIIDLYPRIRATWTRKGITQKMHYSEPCPDAITGRQRRKHSPRVATLPPCADDMDLMIEAKDKEQAVFGLMRNFKLPGWERINDLAPHERDDENRPLPKTLKKKAKKATPKKNKKKAGAAADEDEDGDAVMPDVDLKEEEEEDAAPKEPAKIPESEVGLGGPNNRVFWPQGMEEWLRPKKRIITKKPTGKSSIGGEDEE
ncbi:UV-endonuclease UvdE-domain-containing protein [Microdochium bolleyi]|uniref:UV-endonuclease UvdE-domain-containing protein n=1 Tax=Microdochium bolleyi TaxID=196109 RepID=A0A136J8I9_9PEZI|nr:UV-endonuclease UvdE-domain-containing protein [Microdochium bolleyi]